MPDGCGNPPPGTAAGYPGVLPSVAAYIPSRDRTMVPFDVFGEVTIANSGAATAWTDIIAFSCGQGRRGFLEWIGADSDNLTAWQDLEWRVSRSGATVGGVVYPAMEQPFGFAPPYLNPFPCFFESEDVLVLQVRRPAAGATDYTVRGRLKGVTTAAGADS